MNRSTLALSFEKAIERFLLAKHAEGFSPSIIEIDEWGLKKIKANSPELIIEIKKQDLLKIFSNLRDEGLKPANIQNVWISMRAFFKWVEKELSLQRPDLDIPCPRATPPIIILYSR